MADLVESLNTALAGRYAIQRELGRGGMATVLLADDLRHHRPVAIKVLHRELAEAIGAERFLREIEIAAGLNHPLILPVHDSGSAGEWLFYVMPYVAGDTLQRRLHVEKQLPVDDALRIVHDVAEALEYAHRKGIVHRDIKPANLLLVEGHAVVADFGIARAIATTEAGRLTTANVAIGTPVYMSPEQSTGRHDVDGRSDLYSLACVLYEMLSGQPPFTGPTPETILHQRLTLEPRPVEALRPSVPRAVSDALRQALARSAADRQHTVAEFAAALSTSSSAALLEAASTVAAPVSAPPSRVDRLKRWNLAAIAAVVGIAGVIALFSPIGPCSPARRAIAGPPSLAVLYFQNLGASRDDDYLAAGVTEDVTTSLAQIPGIRVASRTAVERYRGRPLVPNRVGRELGVGLLLEGSIRRFGDQLRVTAQLIRARDGMELWADRYDGNLSGIFAIPDSIARQIASGLRVTLAPGSAPQVTRRWTDNAQAYAAYLIGRETYFDIGRSPETAKDARPWFEKALALDPEFAPALAALADVIASDDGGRRSPHALDTALALARRAQRIDPALSIGWRAEARVQSKLGDIRKARELLEHAVEVDPRVRENYTILASVCEDLGDRSASEAAIRRGIEVGSDWPTAWMEANRRYLARGDFDASERLLAEGFKRLPGNPLLLCARAEQRMRRRQWDLAEKDLRSAAAADPNNANLMVRLADALDGASKRAQADSVYAAMLVVWPRSPWVIARVGYREGTRGHGVARDSLYRRAIELEPFLYWVRRDLIWTSVAADAVAAADKAAAELTRLWPEDAIACEDIARKMYDLRDYKRAERWARKSIALNPHRSSAHDQLGWDCMAQGRYGEGLEAFRAAIAASPGTPVYHLDLARSLYTAGQYAEAKAAAERSVELSADYLVGMRVLGNSYGRLGKPLQAAAVYERMLTIAPDDVPAINNLAIIYYYQDRIEKAVDLFRRAAALDSNSSYPRLNLAFIAIEERDWGAARQLGTECVRRGRGRLERANAYSALGIVEQLTGHTAAATDHFVRARAISDSLLRVDAGNYLAHQLAGTLNARLGAIAEARRHRDWLLENRGSDPDALYSVACIASLSGDRETALDFLGRAINAGYYNVRGLRLDTELANIRNDPRFATLAARVK